MNRNKPRLLFIPFECGECGIEANLDGDVNKHTNIHCHSLHSTTTTLSTATVSSIPLSMGDYTLISFITCIPALRYRETLNRIFLNQEHHTIVLGI